MSLLRSMFPASGTPDRFLLLWKALKQILPDLPSDLPPGISLAPLPAPEFEEPVLRSLVHLIGTENLSTDPEILTRHGCGLSYRGFLLRQVGTALPLAVVYPESEAQLTALMLWAAGRELRLRPWGGGSAITPLSAPAPAYLVLNLARLHRIQRLDAQNGQVTVQAGLRWDALEQALNAQGLSTGLGLFAPESTVGGALARLEWTPWYLEGGWLARVWAVRGITPAGPVNLSLPLPGLPDARSLLLGQEGAWGVITEATLRITFLPENRLTLDADVPDWDTGISVMRRFLQERIPLSWARLTPLLEWGVFTPQPAPQWRQPFYSLRDQGRMGWVRLSLTCAGRSEANAHIRREIERLLKQEYPEVTVTFRNGEFQEAFWPPRWLDRLHLWERGVLFTSLEALVAWNRAAPFLRDWERALTSIAQTRLGNAWVTSSLHTVFEGALVRSHILAYPSGQDAEALLAHLDAIESVAQTMRQRWALQLPRERPLQTIRSLLADYLDPESIWIRPAEVETEPPEET